MLEYVDRNAGFLDPEREGDQTPELAGVVVIPFGLEATVSWKSGTAAGPQAIIDASHALELWDEELWCEPYRDFGVATLAAPPIPSQVDDALNLLETMVEPVVIADRFPLVLGGEHALTPGAIRPLVKRHDKLTILHIDAHADLRDGYLGEHYSHAAAIRRCLDHDGVDVVSVGLRSISAGEVAFLEANPQRIKAFWAKDWSEWDYDALLRRLSGRKVYVTLDVDALDPSVMAATGTPEPGGLLYGEVCYVLRKVAEAADIVGADIVELAPNPALHACDFTAARLAYKLMSYVLTKESWL